MKTIYIVLIIIGLIFIVGGIATGLYFGLRGGSSPQSSPVIQKLKTMDNFYLKYGFNENQPGVFTKTSDPQNASEFWIDGKVIKYVQRNQNGYRTFF